MVRTICSMRCGLSRHADPAPLLHRRMVVAEPAILRVPGSYRQVRLPCGTGASRSSNATASNTGAPLKLFRHLSTS